MQAFPTFEINCKRLLKNLAMSKIKNANLQPWEFALLITPVFLRNQYYSEL